MKALSLTRPWPWVFLHGPNPKRIENRSWAAPGFIIGQTIALHAAKSWSESGRKFIADVTGLDVPPEHEHRHSEIFAVCRITGCVDIGADDEHLDGQEDWFFGPFGWLVEDFYALPEPVPIKGAQGLWYVNQARLRIKDTPDDVETAIRMQRLLGREVCDYE
jgi:hypothetical protein